MLTPTKLRLPPLASYDLMQIMIGISKPPKERERARFMKATYYFDSFVHSIVAYNCI